MALSAMQTLEIIEVMGNFLSRNLPDEDSMFKVEFTYTIEGNSVIVSETYPEDDDPIELLMAKATYVKSKDIWKVYYMRADERWHIFRPQPAVKSIMDFARLVEKDDYHLFWA